MAVEVAEGISAAVVKVSVVTARTLKVKTKMGGANVKGVPSGKGDTACTMLAS